MAEDEVQQIRHRGIFVNTKTKATLKLYKNAEEHAAANSITTDDQEEK